MVDHEADIVGQQLGRHARLDAPERTRPRRLQRELIREHRKHRLDKRLLATQQPTHTRLGLRPIRCRRAFAGPEPTTVSTDQLGQPVAAVAVVGQARHRHRGKRGSVAGGITPGLRRFIACHNIDLSPLPASLRPMDGADLGGWSD